MVKKLRILPVLVIACMMLLAMTAAAADLGTGVIDADALRVRENATTDSKILGLLQNGATVTIKGQEEAWYLIDFDGQTGYIHSDYVHFTPLPAADEAAAEETEEAATEESSEETAATADEPCIQQQVVDTACTYIGSPYRYGGSGPKGFDCSGFTRYIYGLFGHELPHGASSQMDYGTAVERKDLKMGDLVFFRDTAITSRAASHAGIYIGGNQFIHAANSRVGHVIISDLSERYWNNHYTGARRLIED